MPLKQSVYLVKDEDVLFLCARNGVGIETLYDGNAELIRASAAKPINGILAQPTIFSGVDATFGRLLVEFRTSYDAARETPKVWLQFEDTVLHDYSGTMKSPTISVDGTFESVAFRVPGVNLATSKTVENFEGASEILEKLKETSFNRYVDLTFSVLLEWEIMEITQVDWTPGQNVTEPQRVNVLEKLFSDKLFADCIIVTAEETEIKCHRNVLAANSDIFHAMLTSGLEESQTNVIRMVDVAEDVVNELLAYLYGRDIKAHEKNEEMAFQLLQVAHMYNISSLESLMLTTLLQKENERFNMNVALDLYFFVRNTSHFNGLSEKMLDTMRKRAKDFAAASSYQDLLGKDPTEAAKLAVKLLELGTV